MEKLVIALKGCVAWGVSYVISSRATGGFPFSTKIPEAKQSSSRQRILVFITLT
jgi:hypothetical protein